MCFVPLISFNYAWCLDKKHTYSVAEMKYLKFSQLSVLSFRLILTSHMTIWIRTRSSQGHSDCCSHPVESVL